MISVCAKIRIVQDDEEHLDKERTMSAARALGIPNPRQLEIRAGLSPNNLNKYFGGVNPASDSLLRLTELLGVPPSYLYGRPMDQVRRNLIAMVRKVFGADEANALEIFAVMTGEQKTRFVRMLDAFVGEQHEPSAFERDATERASKPAARHAAIAKKK